MIDIGTLLSYMKFVPLAPKRHVAFQYQKYHKYCFFLYFLYLCHLAHWRKWRKVAQNIYSAITEIFPSFKRSALQVNCRLPNPDNLP